MHKSAFIKINWEVYIFIMKFDWQNSEGQGIWLSSIWKLENQGMLVMDSAWLQTLRFEKGGTGIYACFWRYKNSALISEGRRSGVS